MNKHVVIQHPVEVDLAGDVARQPREPSWSEESSAGEHPFEVERVCYVGRRVRKLLRSNDHVTAEARAEAEFARYVDRQAQNSSGAKPTWSPRFPPSASYSATWITTFENSLG